MRYPPGWGRNDGHLCLGRKGHRARMTSPGRSGEDSLGFQPPTTETTVPDPELPVFDWEDVDLEFLNVLVNRAFLWGGIVRSVPVVLATLGSAAFLGPTGTRLLDCPQCNAALRLLIVPPQDNGEIFFTAKCSDRAWCDRRPNLDAEMECAPWGGQIRRAELTGRGLSRK